MSFINFIEDSNVGSLYIDDLVLVPGDNDVALKGNIDQATVLEVLATRPYCEDGIVPFKLLGDNVTNHGEDISYFATALGSGNQTVDINIGKIAKAAYGFLPGCPDN